jgi:hypothetical protein
VPQDGIYVYFRYTASDRVMVVVNRNKEDKALELGRFKEMLKDYRFGNDVISGSKFDLSRAIAVPAETALILDLE